MPGQHKNRTPVHRRPMLSDVAKEAGVSTASVSRVLNAPQTVKPSTLKKVTDAINKLGYLPDGAARALASGHHRTIGAVVPTLDNAIFASCINALQRRLAQRQFALLVASSDYSLLEELREAKAMAVHGVAGLFLVGSEHSEDLYKLIQHRGMPYVNTWSYIDNPRHPCIGFDNNAATQRLTNYLLDLGHTRIAMLAGISKHNDRVVGRINGVKEALKNRGLSLAPEYLIEQPYDIRRGRDALRQFWYLPNRPTAIVCGNDVLAYGALLESMALDIDVPGSLSIVGFDDLPMSGNFVPALTTVKVPASSIGFLAADYLVDRIEGKTPALHTELDADLVVRATTAPPIFKN